MLGTKNQQEKAVNWRERTTPVQSPGWSPRSPPASARSVCLSSTPPARNPKPQ